MNKQADDIRSEFEKKHGDYWDMMDSAEQFGNLVKVGQEIIDGFNDKLQKQKQKYASREKVLIGLIENVKNKWFGDGVVYISRNELLK